MTVKFLVNAVLSEMERRREAYWLRYLQTSPTKLRWRAITVRQCLHVLPDGANAI